MKKIKYYAALFVCMYCFTGKIFSQDDAAKILLNTYFNCFGKAPGSSEFNRDMRLINTQDTASIKNLLAGYFKLIKDSAALQKDIIKTAFENTYGTVSQTQIDSFFKSINNGALTYQVLMNEMKNKLNKNLATDELKIIQRSYNDYFGIQINKEDVRVKALMDSSMANEGIFYKTLMDEQRLYVITSPAEQKAIINRAFNAVFGRVAKVAELDSWFNACKYSCPYIDLIKKLEAYKKNNLQTQALVLAPASAGDVIYIRIGVILNEVCNCIGKKMFLVNADAAFSYKVSIAYYNIQSNTTIISQFVIAPHHEKLLGCTKDIDCVHSLFYSVLRYEKI